jgi:hypothetical protein
MWTRAQVEEHRRRAVDAADYGEVALCDTTLALMRELADARIGELSDQVAEGSGNARPSWPAPAVPASHRVLSHRIDRLVEDLRALASRVEQLKPGVISLAARNSEVPP